MEVIVFEVWLVIVMAVADVVLRSKAKQSSMPIIFLSINKHYLLFIFIKM